MHVLKFLVGALLIGGAFLPSSADATVAPTDYIASVFLSSAGNEAFRVVPRNPSTLSASCTGGFVYVNASADNYQAWVAALMSAYLSGKQVTLNYNVVGSFCQIVEFGVSG